jgi:hypothetical protein
MEKSKINHLAGRHSPQHLEKELKFICESL